MHESIALNILLFALVGFVAQLVDGALGMAYGVSSNTLLLSLGLPPATASACVHTAETFTTAVSGVSHFKFGNVNRKLFLTLLIPGVLGGVLGAYILTTIPTNIIKPIVAGYLLLMGVVILIKTFRRVPAQAEAKPEPKTGRVALLGLAGGFFDAIGGGGWGPIVTSTLVARGEHPRYTIGTVNSAEFFVTTAQAVTFFAVIGAIVLENWSTIVGLLLGGVIAAPLAAYVCKRIAPRTLMGMVGALICVLSIRTIVLVVMG